MKKLLLVVLTGVSLCSAKLPLQPVFIDLHFDGTCFNQPTRTPAFSIQAFGGVLPYTFTLNGNTASATVGGVCAQFNNDDQFQPVNLAVVKDSTQTSTIVSFTNNNSLKSSLEDIKLTFILNCTGVKMLLAEFFPSSTSTSAIKSVTLINLGTAQEYSVKVDPCTMGSCFQSVDNLVPGKYRVTIAPSTSQGAPCDNPVIIDFEITHEPLSLASLVSTRSCGSSSGSLSVQVRGGNGPYMYSFQDKKDPSNKGSSGPTEATRYTFEGLDSGTYDISVSDTSIDLKGSCSFSTYYSGCTVRGTRKIERNCGFLSCCE